jgi:hypothetical protein
VIEDSATYGGWAALLYVYCALRQMPVPGLPGVDLGRRRTEQRREMLMLVFANAGLRRRVQIAPGADLADSRLDAVAFANMPMRRRLPIMVKLLRGTHGAVRGGGGPR